jgi:hypothetical protein
MLDWLIIGDSHVAAIGPALVERFARLKADPPLAVDFISNRGWSTKRTLAEVDIPEAKNYIVISGTNDWPGERYPAVLKAFGSKLRSHGARVFWWGPPAVANPGHAERVQTVRMLQKQILPGLGIIYVDSVPFSAEGHQKDLIHYTPPGYAAWTKGAFGAMTSKSSVVGINLPTPAAARDLLHMQNVAKGIAAGQNVSTRDLAKAAMTADQYEYTGTGDAMSKLLAARMTFGEKTMVGPEAFSGGVGSVVLSKKEQDRLYENLKKVRETIHAAVERLAPVIEKTGKNVRKAGSGVGIGLAVLAGGIVTAAVVKKSR